MNGMELTDHLEHVDVLSEGRLRLALQLETDEHPPRFDAAAIAAAAERRTVLEQVQRAVRGTALVGIALGFEAAVAVFAFNALADLDLTGPVAVGLSLVVAVAERVVLVGQLTTGPSVAVAALAAVLLAIGFERSIGREPLSVRAS
jgi:hypothetical protein